MISEPLLSVITVNKNNGDKLEKTLQSVSGQTARHFELIVVDGASTDNSLAVINKYSNSIDRWISEPDSGIYNAMNKGVTMAKGKYCYFLNSGDIFCNHKVVEKILPHLEKNEYHTLGFSLYRQSNDNRKYLTHSPKEITLSLFSVGTLDHQACVTLRKALIDNPFDESLRIASDWKFYLGEFTRNRLSYRRVKTPVSVFKCDGISQTNKALLSSEREEVIRNLDLDITSLFNKVPWEIIDIYQHLPHRNVFTRFLIRLNRFLYSIYPKKQG